MLIKESCATTFGEEDGHLSVAPVASFPAGASPYGVIGMTGNVWEWLQMVNNDLRIVKGIDPLLLL